jgi:hypothetical protein
MSRSRPDVVFLIDVAAPKGRRQLLAKSPRDLVTQLQPLAPDLPAATLRQLAGLMLNHDAQVQLSRPVRLTLKHAGTLTRSAPENVSSAPADAAPASPTESETEEVSAAPGAPRAVRMPPPRPLFSSEVAPKEEGEHDDT